ncbi:hypothetical protein [Paraburkholderia youngii]|uniref:DNA-binding protein n=1 Tax=Paraburkholderia youngii TaxID=2782701 RepID=A0A7Y6JZD6_9BURK|nr:hypothetical protein [Paraburkholderia youngii]NUY01556.1 hypothetical protein [Paraburkholderia youngii]
MDPLDDDRAARIAELERRLYARLREGGYPVAGDGSTSEAGAAACLGCCRSALAKQHAMGKLRLPYRRNGRSRWYAVADLARFMIDGWHNR